MRGEKVNNIVTHSRYKYCYKLRFKKDYESVVFGMQIHSEKGIVITSCGSKLCRPEQMIENVKDGDVYGRDWDVEKYESILDSVLEREYNKNLIYLAIKDGFTSVRDINKKIGLNLLLISRLIADMEKTNKVEFTGMENKIPVFAAL